MLFSKFAIGLAISCDSEFMLGVMDRVGKALRDSFKWVKPNEWMYLVMDNARGHGTDEAWEMFTRISRRNTR
jgi:hypothetical protein